MNLLAAPFALLFSVSLFGCQGLVVTPEGDEPRTEFGADPNCEPAETVATQPIRRISSEHYANVLRDLVPGSLGGELVTQSTFPATVIEGGFASDAVANLVNTAESNAIEDNAETLATYILDNADSAIPALMSCVDGGFSDADIDACLPTFVDEFGGRAYRRPLNDNERAILTGLYDSIRSSQGSRTAFAAVMQVFFQAPQVLYRAERGLDRGGDDLSLSGHEMASRVSFFLGGTLPDEALFSAAAADELQTPEQIEAHARRLVTSDRALEVVSAFHRDWLHTYVVGRDARNHPASSPAVQDALAREIDGFIRWAFVEGDGRYETILSTTQFPVDPVLVDVYGVESPSGAAVEVPNRHGILTLGSVLSAFATEDETSPIPRGAFIREAVLCGDALLLPSDIDPVAALESTSGLSTARERLAPLLETSTCAGCHREINPIGFALENYDQLGVYRTHENGELIDPAGTLAVGALEGRFTDAASLVALIASSEQAMACYATQWFRFAMGRTETEADECAVRDLQQAFIDSGGDVRELMVAITTSRPFMTHSPVEE